MVGKVAGWNWMGNIIHVTDESPEPFVKNTFRQEIQARILLRELTR
jgi:hypothetical protein